MDIKERIRVALGLDAEEQEVKLMYENKLADGTIIVSEADELVEDTVLNILSEDGMQTPMPAGTYALEDGTEFTTDESGVVLEVGEAKEEEEKEETEEEEVEMANEATVLEEVGAVVKELLEEVRNDINKIKAELDEVRNENLSKDENILELQSELDTLNNEPSGEPLQVNKFKSHNRINKCRIQKIVCTR